jgi:hypothetical protein
MWYAAMVLVVVLVVEKVQHSYLTGVEYQKDHKGE